MTVAFARDLPHGRLVGVEIAAEAPLERLLPDERAFAEALPAPRRPSWVAGRLALRAALVDLGLEAGPLLATDRGGPLLPPQAAGSISHKRTLAVALAAPGGSFALGVDLEEDLPLRVDVSRRVLRPEEAAAVAGLPERERQREVLLRLSAKEAIYKALDPFVRRHVSFKEAAVEPRQDGTASATLALTQGEGPFRLEVRWLRIDPFLVTTARVDRPPKLG